MKIFKSLNITFYLIFLLSCELELPPVIIQTNSDIISKTTPINDFIKTHLEGIYSSSDSKNEFGETLVIKCSGESLSIFTGKNGAYLIFYGGILDTTLAFEGYWRFSSGSETGLAKLVINKEDGADDLISGKEPEALKIKCYYYKGPQKNEKIITLTYLKPLNNIPADFKIIAHRGGGRNSDRLAFSENSIGMILFAERLGANAIEIDVKLTKDKIPVLFHDENLSLRLINESYFVGSISNYTYDQLSTFVTLKNGGKIPTLEEALDTVLYKTNLKLVWLDIKSDGLIADVTKVQKKYVNKAKAMNRDLEILIGLPTNDIVDEYLSIKDKKDIPAICELSFDDVRSTDAYVWAPRWSLGLQTAETDIMHSEGRRVFTWTLDDAEFIKVYLKDGNFDGILSNYSSIVAYEYYIK
ncbi:MAG: glycerophosphodiester phosphodiesterase family protein [bacterium]